MATNLPPSVLPKRLNASTRAERMYDDIIEEIHAQRAAVSNRFGGIMAAIVGDYQSFDVSIAVSQHKPRVRPISSVP